MLPGPCQPHNKGLEATLTVDQGLASAPVVMLTSSSAEADRQSAADFTCVKGYVVKPLTRLAALQLPQIDSSGGSDQELG